MTDLEPTHDEPTHDDRPPGPGGGARPAWVAALVAAAVLVLGIGAFAAVQRGDGADDPDAAAGDEDGWHGAYLPTPQPRPDFTLTDTSGAPYDFAAETGGRLTLLFFGYTSCPDVCPIHMATLSSALRQPGMPEPIVVFVTTDPARDTPDHLRSWLDQFDTDFVGLTGTPEQVAAAEDAAGVARSIAATEDGSPPAAGADAYEVGHAAQIVAYTPDDLNHVQYPFGVRRQDWQADLPRMLEVWGAPSDVTVSDAWAAADETVTAVYLTIDNPGADDRLVRASTDVAGRVSAMGPDVAMRDGATPDGTELDLALPPGTTELAPGGTHVMLERLTRPLAVGEQVVLRLEFDRAGPVEVPVAIVGWDEVVERVERGAAP